MRPNAWGLHGMSGNVSEWCADRYDWKYYASSPDADPLGAARPTARVFGGAVTVFHNGPLSARPAYRNGLEPSYRGDTIGFRVAMNPSPTNRASLNGHSEPAETATSAGGLPTTASERPARAAAATGRQSSSSPDASGAAASQPAGASLPGQQRHGDLMLKDQSVPAGKKLRLPLGAVELGSVPPRNGAPGSFRLLAPFRTKPPDADGAIGPDEYGPPLAIDFTDDKNPGLDVFLGPNPAKSRKDLSADLYLAYTRDALFVAVTDRDDTLSDRRDAPHPRSNDGVELFLDGDRLGGDLRPGSREGFQVASTARGRKYANGVGTSDQDYVVKTSTFHGGYIVEFQIPLATIDVSDGAEVAPPGPGSTLRFNMAIVDNDKPVDGQQRYCALWSDDRTKAPMDGDGAWPVDLHLALPVKYELAAGPKGAAVDPETGVFTWDAPNEPRTEKVTVRVRDVEKPEITTEGSFTITTQTTSSGPMTKSAEVPAGKSSPTAASTLAAKGRTAHGKAPNKKRYRTGDEEIAVPFRVATNGLAGTKFIAHLRPGPIHSATIDLTRGKGGRIPTTLPGLRQRGRWSIRHSQSPVSCAKSSSHTTEPEQSRSPSATCSIHPTSFWGGRPSGVSLSVHRRTGNMVVGGLPAAGHGTFPRISESA